MNVKGCTFRVCCIVSCNRCEVPIGGKFTQLKRTRLATLEIFTGVKHFEQWNLQRSSGLGSNFARGQGLKTRALPPCKLKSI